MARNAIPGMTIAGVLALALTTAGCGDNGKKDNASSSSQSAATAPAGTMASDAAPGGMVPLDVVDKAGAKMSGDPSAGEAKFRQCEVCHSTDAGVNKIGPSLHGVIGRPAGQVPDFSYSDANKNSGKVWNEQTIFEYLENPRAYIPGTKMSYAGLPKEQDRANVIAYLAQATK